MEGCHPVWGQEARSIGTVAFHSSLPWNSSQEVQSGSSYCHPLRSQPHEAVPGSAWEPGEARSLVLASTQPNSAPVPLSQPQPGPLGAVPTLTPGAVWPRAAMSPLATHSVPGTAHQVAHSYTLRTVVLESVPLFLHSTSESAETVET